MIAYLNFSYGLKLFPNFCGCIPLADSDLEGSGRPPSVGQWVLRVLEDAKEYVCIFCGVGVVDGGETLVPVIPMISDSHYQLSLSISANWVSINLGSIANSEACLTCAPITSNHICADDQQERSLIRDEYLNLRIFLQDLIGGGYFLLVSFYSY